MDRTARRRVVTGVALLAFAIALVSAYLQGDEAREKAAAGRAHEWGDLTRSCAGGLVPDDRDDVQRAGAQFFAAKPELMASETGATAVAAVFRSRDDRAVAICRGAALTGGLESFITTVHPLRSSRNPQDASPLTHQVACSDAGRCTAALVIADRLDPKLSGLLVQLEGGEEVRLTPQRGPWIARVVEVEVGSSTTEVAVERVVYLDEAGQHLAEWVPPTEARNPALAPVSRFPFIDKECLLGARC